MKTNEFQGHALDSRFKRGRSSGTLVIHPSAVTFHTADTSIILPLNNLEITLGGSGNRIIYLRNLSIPGSVLYCSDKTILENKLLLNTAGCAESIKKIKKKKLLNLATIFVFLFCSVLLFVGGYFGLRLIADIAASNIPPKYEAKVGEKLFRLITLDKRFLDTSSLREQLAVLTDPLVGSIEDKNHTFSFYIIEDTTINAFALPGGKVVIHSGLLLNAASAEEVTGVLAHEICHVTGHHHLRGLINNVGTVLLIQAVFGDASALIATISELGGNLSTLKNSRTFELEADRTAWELLKRSGVTPHGMINFFQTIKTKRNPLENALESNLDFMSTHPDLDRRIKVLQERWEQESKNFRFHPLDIDYQAFLKKLQNLLQQ